MASAVVVMGVCGAGKSVVGSALAASLGAVFTDIDSLHPPANVEKMRTGTPQDNADRWPWLQLVGTELADAGLQGSVVACFALKRSYREVIRRAAPQTIFIQLAVDSSVLQERLLQRPGHFMPATLLASQLATLEPLEADEAGAVLPSKESIEETVNRIREFLAQRQWQARSAS